MRVHELLNVHGFDMISELEIAHLFNFAEFGRSLEQKTKENMPMSFHALRRFRPTALMGKEFNEDIRAGDIECVLTCLEEIVSVGFEQLARFYAEDTVPPVLEDDHTFEPISHTWIDIGLGPTRLTKPVDGAKSADLAGLAEGDATVVPAGLDEVTEFADNDETIDWLGNRVLWNHRNSSKLSLWRRK